MSLGINNLIFILLAIFQLDSTDGACYSYESCLVENLFANYSAKVRPVVNSVETIEVEGALYLKTLGGIDEKNEIMTLVATLYMQWTDQFLAWNPDDYNGTSYIVLFAEDVWLPDLAIVNSVGEYYKSTYKEDFRINLYADGSVVWDFGGTIMTSCSLNIANYPFDEQHCSLLVQNWAYFEEVDLQFLGEGVFTTDYEKNALWNVESIKTIRHANAAIRQPQLEFKFTLRRKTLYYMFNIVSPTVLISIITLGLFWLPPACGEKLGLGITVLLAYSVFQIIIMDNTPVNSDVTPRLSKLMIFVMAMATVSILVTILTLIVDASNSVNRPPFWLRKVAFKVFAPIFFLKSEIPDIPDENKVNDDDCEVKELPDKNSGNKKYVQSESENVLSELKKITSYLESKQMDENIANEWKLIAKIIDRLMFWICLVIIIIYFIYIFSTVNYR